MDEPQTLDGQLVEAIFVELIRDGIIPEAVIERVARGFERQAETSGGVESAARFATLAAMAGELLTLASAPDPVEFTADQRRADVRKRTAWLARQSDGGNPD